MENTELNTLGFCPLVASDATTFRNGFQKDIVCYANSWLYTIRSSRNDHGEMGYKSQLGDGWVGVGFRNDVVYITRPSSSVNTTVLLRLCLGVYELTHKKIVLKKIDEKLRRDLVATRYFRADFSPDDSRILEDELYPEHLIFLDRLFFPNGRLRYDASNLARQSRKFQRRQSELDMRFDPLIEPKTILGQLRLLIHDNDNKYSAYVPIVQEAFSKETRGLYKTCIFYDENRFHGVYISECLDHGKMGLYCAISSREYRGITEWMDMCFLRHLLETGTACVFLGGSETLGVHNYVQKLMPVPPPYVMAPVVYEPRY